MPYRVLVVDDEEAIRSLVRDYLESQGYRVSAAADGDEGIRVFRQERPHLVMVDFLLPKKNGFAVAEAIRKDDSNPHTPILMMSGVFKNPKTAVEARDKYKVIDFLSKPLDMDRVASLIAGALSNVEPEKDEEPPRSRSVELPPDRAPRPPPSRSSNGVVGREESGAMSLEMDSEPPVDGTDDEPPPRGLSYYGRASSAAAAPARQPTARSTRPNMAPPRMSSSAAAAGDLYRGRPFPDMGLEGELEQLPVALLLSMLRYDSATGMLDLTDQGTHRRIYIVKGQPTFMQSNAEGENVGALLLRRGRITEPDFQRCLAYMKAKGRTLQQSMLELRLANEQDLATAYKLLAGQLLPLALSMAQGRYRWQETDVFIGRVPEGNFEPVQVLFEGIKRHVHPPQIIKFFKGREDVPLVKTAEFDKLMPFFRRAFSATNIAHEIDGKQTYRELSRRHAQQAANVVPQLFALVTSGMAVLPDITEDNMMDVAVNAAAAEIQAGDQFGEVQFADDDDSPGDATPEERRVRAAILRYHDEVMSKDFFQIFGVNREAEADRIKASYFDLAKKWHVDAYAGMNLGPARGRLDAIFQRITEAYETITDKGRREEYVVFLDRQAKGLPTNPNDILRGERLFDQALAMIRRRDWPGAKGVLEEALALNPSDALYYAHLGWVLYNLNPRAQENLTQAVQQLKRAVNEQENCPIAYQYLGQIAFARGQANEARKWWQKCLEWEPNNIEASRGLRMLSSKDDKDRASKSGLLSKFLNKK